jgi:hypothetical protein
MAVICPSCGTSNADGNRFCANCGTALAAATPTPAGPPPAATPTPAVPPPAVPPPAVTSPAATPPAATPPAPAASVTPPAPTPTPPSTPVAAGAPPGSPPPGGTSGPSMSAGLPLPPRLPRPLLYGGLLAGVLIAVVLGVAAGSVFGGSGGKDNPTPTPFVKPTAAATPQTTPNTDPTPNPTQTPAGETPAPLTPTPTPEVATPSTGTGTGTGGASQVVDVKTVSVTIPGDWTVDATKDYLISVFGPKGGQLILISGVIEKTTLDAFIQDFIDTRKKNAADMTVCLAPTPVKVDNGPLGKELQLCWTASRQDGTKYQAVADFVIAVSDDGTILYSSEVYAEESLFDEFATFAWQNVTPTTKWKLYKAP